MADAQSETLLADVELSSVLADADEAFDESDPVDDEPTLGRTYCECKPPSGMCEIGAP